MDCRNCNIVYGKRLFERSDGGHCVVVHRRRLLLPCRADHSRSACSRWTLLNLLSAGGTTVGKMHYFEADHGTLTDCTGCYGCC